MVRIVSCINISKYLNLSLEFADVAELVDALDLGSSIERCGGSSPFIRTFFPLYEDLNSPPEHRGVKIVRQF